MLARVYTKWFVTFLHISDTSVTVPPDAPVSLFVDKYCSMLTRPEERTTLEHIASFICNNVIYINTNYKAIGDLLSQTDVFGVIHDMLSYIRTSPQDTTTLVAAGCMYSSLQRFTFQSDRLRKSLGRARVTEVIAFYLRELHPRHNDESVSTGCCGDCMELYSTLYM